MSFPGGKSLSGVYQFIINHIPPHKVYIETHLGGGAVIKNKKPADINIGVDVDPSVVKLWSENDSIQLIQQDALEYLNQYEFTGDEFVYVDPPYLHSIRKSNRRIYDYEYSDEQHSELLNRLLSLKCNVMISGYTSDLYNEKLLNWRKVEFQSRNRRGDFVTECLWMNYPYTNELHDYQYLGGTFRERERIKRRNDRWVSKLKSLPILEQKALLAQLMSA